MSSAERERDWRGKAEKWGEENGREMSSARETNEKNKKLNASRYSHRSGMKKFRLFLGYRDSHKRGDRNSQESTITVAIPFVICPNAVITF